jgi:hypothetical protein
MSLSDLAKSIDTNRRAMCAAADGIVRALWNGDAKGIQRAIRKASAIAVPDLNRDGKIMARNFAEGFDSARSRFLSMLPVPAAKVADRLVFTLDGAGNGRRIAKLAVVAKNRRKRAAGARKVRKPMVVASRVHQQDSTEAAFQ